MYSILENRVLIFPYKNDTKGEFMILEIWKIVTDSVDDLRVVNTDAISYLLKTHENCLQELVRAKKNIYLDVFFQQRRHFPPSSPPLIGYWVWRPRLP